MADLVFQNSNGNDVTTSLIVAQVFGKRNSDVLRDIRSLNCSESFRKRNFALMVKKNELPQGGSQKSEYYEMTKDGFSFLVMGYTGAKAGEFKERFINEFNRRESLLKDDDYILMRSQQILQKRLEASEEKIKQLESQAEQQQETIELQQQELTQSAPKKYLFSFGDLQNCCTFAMRHFYSHIRVGDFLCPIDSYCLKYKQRFLRTYLPQSRYGSVATWRNSLLSLFINV